MASQPFDDRPGVIWFNGEFVPWQDAKVHVLTHGLHYGSGVFEGERAYGGEIFKLDEHTAPAARFGGASSASRFPIRSKRSTTPARSSWSGRVTTTPMSGRSPGAAAR